MDRRSGHGNVAVIPGAGPCTGRVFISLRGADAAAVLQVPAADTRFFLQRTGTVVPAGVEEEHLDIDALVRGILAPGAVTTAVVRSQRTRPARTRSCRWTSPGARARAARVPQACTGEGAIAHGEMEQGVQRPRAWSAAARLRRRIGPTDHVACPAGRAGNWLVCETCWPEESPATARTVP
ncbi:SsgA family sporulation/cell division regulator [Kitasatospora cineracea]|uniref:SsgA family sporulation/cell division regulator n=1 Tax=Kitasatospora cineracea TaxID=88074 RepID=UPI0037941B62